MKDFIKYTTATIVGIFLFQYPVFLHRRYSVRFRYGIHQIARMPARSSLLTLTSFM